MSIRFCDDAVVFNQFKKQYSIHKRGFFIVAPSGAGKTYFVKNQKDPDWIDGDDLWMATGAQPNRAWWTEGIDVINEVDKRCDVVTEEYRKNGFWIIGASNFWAIPDAVVIPDFRLQKKYIICREQTNYDGGATSKDFKQVIKHRKTLTKHARQNKVPIFKTIEDAVNFLRKKYKM